LGIYRCARFEKKIQSFINMLRSSRVAGLVALAATGSYGFIPLQPSMGLAAPSDSTKVAIVGARSGLSGVIADRLTAEGGARSVLFLEQDVAQLSSSEAKVVIVSADAGPDAGAPLNDLVRAVVPALPSTAEYLIYTSSPEQAALAVEGEESKKAGFSFQSFFSGTAAPPLTAVREAPGVKVVVLHTGRLFGAASTAEPVPFVGGLKAEPKLDESWTRRAALIGAGTLLAQNRGASTKRVTAADAIAQYLRGEERSRGAELSVVSVEGIPPSAEEWAEEFDRLDDSAGVSVLAIDFDGIPRRSTLTTWLVDSWGPATLRKVESNMIRSGARPVRVALLQSSSSAYAPEGGVEVVWEAPTANLEVETTGRLQVLLRGEAGSAGMRVVRCNGKGEPLIVPLVGEDEIIQSLLEGINAVAYTKGYVTRKTSAAGTAAAATAAASKAKADATAATASAAAPKAAVEPKAAEQAPAAPAPAQPKGRGRRAKRTP
jgi:hypothetical protein